uniref:BPL/LPL catalytic domain-containing protein n=1 Tax=Rhabditophanes sp. KR3021 TaxID=114890 RepID=A0AC35TYJ5_9BILA
MACSYTQNKAFKPPTVLVYCGDGGSKECGSKFQEFTKTLKDGVPEDVCTTVLLSNNTLNKGNWLSNENECLVVYGNDGLDEKGLKQLEAFRVQGGKVLTIGEDNGNVSKDDIYPDAKAATKKIMDILNVTELDAKRKEVHDLTRCNLLFKKDIDVIDVAGLEYNVLIGQSPKIIYKKMKMMETDDMPESTGETVVVKVGRRDQVKCDDFDHEAYFNHLKTDAIGHSLMHTDVCTSTMDLTTSFIRGLHDNKKPVTVVANYQTKGVGRSGNQWLSPKGCCMFSFSCNLDKDSYAGKHLTLMQHLLSVSVVDAIKSLIHMPEFPLQIKWPNDIYYNKQFKMGGIIANVNDGGHIFKLVFGVGLNVSNDKPTVCINELLPEGMEKLDKAVIIAEVMNKFEEHLKTFETRGVEVFYQTYYKHWIHSGDEVQIEAESGKVEDREKCVIKGLGEHGYLRVMNLQTKKIFDVSDDGNSFDMLKGLIRTKF